jgi:hypothetical protein
LCPAAAGLLVSLDGAKDGNQKLEANTFKEGRQEVRAQSNSASHGP